MESKLAEDLRRELEEARRMEDEAEDRYSRAFVRAYYPLPGVPGTASARRELEEAEEDIWRARARQERIISAAEILGVDLWAEEPGEEQGEVIVNPLVAPLFQ